MSVTKKCPQENLSIDWVDISTALESVMELCQVLLITLQQHCQWVQVLGMVQNVNVTFLYKKIQMFINTKIF